MKKILLVTLVILISNILMGQNNWYDFNKNGQKDIYEDSAQDIDARIKNLLTQMSLDEKLAQLRSKMNKSSIVIDVSKTKVGIIIHTAANVSKEKGIEVANKIQQNQIEKTRLGIPILFVEEALHGLKVNGATSFPQAIGLAATWDTTLVSKVANVIAKQSLERGVRQVLSPVIDLGRDSRWGRTQETYGEDPYLVARMAVAFCKPLENKGVITTPKHFVANSGDGGRDSWAQFIDERYLREMYFPPYEACIKEAGSRSIMPSYGSLNGLPTVANPWLLTDIARNEWGFKGYFGSDFGAVENVLDRHRITDDSSMVAALCLNAGNDIEWPNSKFYGAPLLKAVQNGLISEKTINDAVKRMLYIKFSIGLFEHPYSIAYSSNKVKERELAKLVANSSFTLLKNANNLLPIKPNKTKSILIVGSKAKEQDLGGYSASGVRTVSIIDGLTEEFPNTKIEYMKEPQNSLNKFVNIPKKLVNNGKGFKMEYYNDSFNTTPIFTKYSNSPNAGWWGKIKIPKLKYSSFGVIWSGAIKLNEDVTPTFDASGSGEFEVYINGKLILSNHRKNENQEKYFFENDYGIKHITKKIKLSKNQNYIIKIKWFCKNEKRTFFHLNWDKRIGLKKYFANLQKKAKVADVVFYVPSGLGEGEFRDRPILDLASEEEQAINLIAENNKNLVVLLVNGSAVTMNRWVDNVPAILETWYSGEEGGKAIAETIVGKNNPSGKLPITFPKFSSQSPNYYNYHPIGRVRGFQDPWKGKPQFPFGFGLSYTKFIYKNLKLSKATVSKNDTIMVSFNLKNIGKYDGAEVTQLYIWDEVASVVRPLRELKGFKKVYLKAGEEKTVTIPITSEHLSFWNKDMQFKMEHGNIMIYVGSSSEDIRLSKEITVLN